jgi:tetraacyldisaccharide 4'-kinase
MYLKYRQNIWIRFILYPFMIIYYILSLVRNKLFDYGIFTIKKFPIPIISVGNITAGGTGKTPFTMYLIGALKQYYKKIAVVSRGYKRKSKGLVIVSDGEGNMDTVERSGDEPFLIAQRSKESVVIVSEKRAEGIALAIDLFSSDLVLLDDAFQHRWIDRDCNIVLINSKKPVSEEYLLPAGNLRESYRQLKRADIIIFTHAENEVANKELAFIHKYYSGPIFTCIHSPDYYLDFSSGNRYSLDFLKSSSVIAFCGIAEPQLFKEILIKQGVYLKDFIIFSDHHYYTEHDLLTISKKAKKKGCTHIITTEKDLIKIGEFKSVDNILLLGLILKIDIKDESNLLQKIKECIDKKSKNG